MLNIASSGNIQIKPPDNYAGRRAADLPSDKAEDVSRLAAASSTKLLAYQQTREKAFSFADGLRADVVENKPQSQTRAVEGFPSVLEEITAQLAVEFNRPLTEVRTPPMPYREFLDLLYNLPEKPLSAAASSNDTQDGLSRFIPLDMKI